MVVVVVVVIVVVVVEVVAAVVDYSLRNFPEERSPLVLRGGILKSRSVYGDTFATVST